MDDEVYKISSEEVPHLTLLYLGNVELSGEAILYVQHAAKELSPFGMSVDHRGTLGEDEADVLFFEKNWAKRVEEFRHHLLLNDEIKKAYDAADQFPEWNPHLTLGYPERPARDGDENRIRYVDFDRIAVWEDDFAGPEFRLKYSDYGSGEVAMSDISTADRGEAAVAELFHYGVKGMRWGVRRAEKLHEGAARNARVSAGVASRKDKVDSVMKDGLIALNPKAAGILANKYGKAASRQDARNAAKDAKVAAKDADKARKEAAVAAHKKWKEEAGGAEMANKVFQKATKDFEKTAEIINNDPNYKGKDVTKGTLGKQYQATMNHYFNQHLAQASVDLTVNDKGRAFIYQFDARSGMMKGTEHQAVLDHADGSEFQMPDYNVELDELGHMVSFSVAGELFHYGVKGMRWGYTTKSDGTVSVNQTKVKKSLRKTDQPVTVTQRKAGTYVKAKGGQRQTASTDAVKAQAARQKAKRSTTDSLSNKELKDANERMRLEQEFAKLDKKVSRKGQSFVARLFRDPQIREASVSALKTATRAA